LFVSYSKKVKKCVKPWRQCGLLLFFHFQKLRYLQRAIHFPVRTEGEHRVSGFDSDRQLFRGRSDGATAGVGDPELGEHQGPTNHQRGDKWLDERSQDSGSPSARPRKSTCQETGVRNSEPEYLVHGGKLWIFQVFGTLVVSRVEFGSLVVVLES